MRFSTLRQIKQDSGEESGFSYAKKKSKKIEVEHRLDEARQNRQNSPANQYPGNPD